MFRPNYTTAIIRQCHTNGQSRMRSNLPKVSDRMLIVSGWLRRVLVCIICYSCGLYTSKSE